MLGCKDLYHEDFGCRFYQSGCRFSVFWFRVSGFWCSKQSLYFRKDSGAGMGVTSISAFSSLTTRVESTAFCSSSRGWLNTLSRYRL